MVDVINGSMKCVIRLPKDTYKMGRTCYWYGGTEPYKKSSRCSGRRKKTEEQAETEMGRRCDGRCQEVGGREIEGMVQGIGTAGRSF